VSKREMPEEEPLNLVPIMNLVTILIPVLLVAIKSFELVVIDTTLPAIGAPTESTEQAKPDKPPLALKLAITNKGIKILGADEYLYPGGRPPAAEGAKGIPDIGCGSKSICRGADDYEWDKLSEKLVTIKDGADNEEREGRENIVLIPEANIQYEILVKAMDTTRSIGAKESKKELFPNVSFAGGTNAN